METRNITLRSSIVFGLKDQIGNEFALEAITIGDDWELDNGTNIPKVDLTMSGTTFGIPDGLLGLAKYGKTEKNAKPIPKTGNRLTIPTGTDVQVKVIAYGKGATLLFKNAEGSWFE